MQLADGAAAFAGQPRRRQTCLLTTDFGNGIGPGFDLDSDTIEEGGTLRAAGIGEAGKRCFRSYGCSIDIRRGADSKRMRRPVGGVLATHRSP